MGSLRADRGLIDPSKGHDARASPESNSGSLGSGVQSRSQKRVLHQGWTKGRDSVWQAERGDRREAQTEVSVS